MKKIVLLFSLLLILFSLLYFQPATFSIVKQTILKSVNTNEAAIPKVLYDGPINIQSVTILESGRWATKAEVVYDYKKKLKNNAYLTADAILETNKTLDANCEGTSSRLIQSEVNKPRKLIVWIMRPRHNSDSVVSQYIQFRVWDYCGSIRPIPTVQATVNYSTPIEWSALPTSQKSVDSLYGDSSLIPMIYIATNVDKSDLLASSLIELGHPLNRLEIVPGISGGNGVLVDIQGQPSVPILGVLFNELAKANPNVGTISYLPESTNFQIRVSRGATKYSTKIDAQFLDQYKPSMPGAALYALLGLPWSSPKDTALRYVAEAKKRLDNDGRKNRSLARELLERAAASDSDIPELYIEYARYYMKENGDFTENGPSATGSYAKGILAEAAKKYPNHANIWVLLGYVQTTQGEFDDAKESYRLAEELGTDNWWLWNNWGLLERKRENYDKAKAMYARVADLDEYTEDNETAYGSAFWALTRLLVADEEYDEAEFYFRKHHSLIPDLYSCMFRMHARMIIKSSEDYEKVKALAQSANQYGCAAQAELSEAYYWQWFHSSSSKGKRDSGLLASAKVAEPNQAKVMHNIIRSKKGVDLLSALLENGEDINVISNGKTALVHAVKSGDRDAVEGLLQQGADPALVLPYPDASPLAVAVLNEDIDMVRLLMHYGANPAKESVYGVPLIEIARQAGRQDLMNALLGADKQGI